MESADKLTHLGEEELQHDSPKHRSQGSFDSNDSGSASNTSATSKDSLPPNKKLPTFTNEVVVIRPE